MIGLLLLAGAGAAAVEIAHDPTHPDASATQAAAAAAQSAAGQTSLSTQVPIGSSIPHALATAGPQVSVGTARLRAGATVARAAVKSATVTSAGGAGTTPYLSDGGSPGSGSNAASVAAAAAFAAAKASAKKNWDAMSHDLKCKACDALNKKYKLSLDCNSTTFENISATVGGALGAAAASLIPIPGATALGAMLGTWAGAKIAPWCESAYADVSSWADGAWTDVSGAVVGAAKDVGNAVEDAASAGVSYVESIF